MIPIIGGEVGLFGTLKDLIGNMVEFYRYDHDQDNSANKKRFLPNINSKGISNLYYEICVWVPNSSTLTFLIHRYFLNMSTFLHTVSDVGPSNNGNNEGPD